MVVSNQMAAILETDNATKAMFASSALLGVHQADRDPSLAQNNPGLREMAEYFGGVVGGHLLGAEVRLDALTPISIASKSTEIEEKAKRLQSTTQALLAGQPSQPENRQELLDFLKKYHSYHRQLLQSGISGERNCWRR